MPSKHLESTHAHAAPRLCVPQLADQLSDTDIVRLKLVQAQANEGSDGVEAPGEALAGLGEALLGDVVGDEDLEAEVGVDEEEAAQDGVGGRVEGAGGERSDGQGHDAGGDEALKGPVVGAVAGVGRGDGRSVVDTADDDLCVVLANVQVSLIIYINGSTSFQHM